MLVDEMGGRGKKRTCLPRYDNRFTRLASPYTLCASAPTSVGVYSPVGVESASAMSALGRTVSVGLGFPPPPPPSPPEVEEGVMLDRRRGHSIIALESVLSRMGRYVSLVYCPVSSTMSSVVGACYKNATLVSFPSSLPHFLTFSLRTSTRPFQQPRAGVRQTERKVDDVGVKSEKRKKEKSTHHVLIPPQNRTRIHQPPTHSRTHPSPPLALGEVALGYGGVEQGQERVQGGDVEGGRVAEVRYGERLCGVGWGVSGREVGREGGRGKRERGGEGGRGEGEGEEGGEGGKEGEGKGKGRESVPSP